MNRLLRTSCGFGVFHVHGLLCLRVAQQGHPTQISKVIPDQTKSKLKLGDQLWLEHELATLAVGLIWQFAEQHKVRPLFNYTPLETAACQPEDLWQQGNLKQWCQGYLAGVKAKEDSVGFAKLRAPIVTLARELNEQTLCPPHLLSLAQALPDTLTTIYTHFAPH